MQIYTGLDLSRKRLDWQALSADGTLVGAGAVPVGCANSWGGCQNSRRACKPAVSKDVHRFGTPQGLL